MITKTSKAYALIAIVPLLLVGFQGNALASHSSSYDGDEVDDALNSMESYVTINNKKIAKIDKSQAKADGISKKEIKIVSEFIKMQNKMINKIHDDPNAKLKMDDKEKEKFKKFFEKAKKGELKNRNEINLISWFDFLLPTVSAADVCGGSEQNPHPAATYSVTGSYATFQAGVAALPSTYHQVPSYASENSGYDYADWVTAYGCADGVFREQTIVYDLDNDGDWQHHNHHAPAEPNPEVLGYWWPVYWWSSYTSWWHDNF